MMSNKILQISYFINFVASVSLKESIEAYYQYLPVRVSKIGSNIYYHLHLSHLDTNFMGRPGLKKNKIKNLNRLAPLLCKKKGKKLQGSCDTHVVVKIANPQL